jgi:hypothetical protein
MLTTNRVNRDAKSLFARLLATENIAVRNDPSAQTASFNVDTRVLVLPILPDMDNDIYDLFVGHEVGHALYTPSLNEKDMLSVLSSICKNLDLAKMTLNVVEDARIELLMRNKYPGLGRSFVMGYAKLLGSGFFGGEEIENPVDLGLLDRINLFYKLRINGLINMETNEIEDHFIQRIDSCSSFEDVVEICKDLVQEILEEAKNKEEQSEIEISVGMDGEYGEGDISTIIQGDNPDTEDEESDSSESEDNNNTRGNIASKTGGGITQSSLRDMSEIVKHIRSTSLSPQQETVYVYNTLPSPNLDNIIVHWKDIHFLIDSWLEDANKDPKGIRYSRYNHDRRGEIFDIDEIYNEFMARNRSASTSMSQSFYRRMAAYTSRHSRIAKTGRLNMDIIHTYKYNDDLFLNSTFVPKGKNHGMILYMDWSGSMSNDFVRTIEQLLNLVMFCRAVKIPFEVYGFSSVVWNEENYMDRPCWNYPEKSEDKRCYDKRGTPMAHLDMVTLLNIFSSSMNHQEFVKACKNILALAYSLSSEIDAYAPRPLRLGGTPLEEAIIAGMEVAKRFRSKNGIQILNTIVLSDGESSGIHCWTNRDTPYYTPKKDVIEHEGRSYVIRDRFMNHCLRRVLQMYKDTTGSRMIGFYLVPSQYSNRVLNDIDSVNRNVSQNSAPEIDIEERLKSFRKNKFVDVPFVGYDRYYLMSPSLVGMSVDDMFKSIDSSADTKKMVREFVKSSGNGAKTRILLNAFAELVAQEI